jgi:hypothetical protein
METTCALTTTASCDFVVVADHRLPLSYRRAYFPDRSSILNVDDIANYEG